MGQACMYVSYLRLSCVCAFEVLTPISHEILALLFYIKVLAQKK